MYGTSNITLVIYYLMFNFFSPFYLIYVQMDELACFAPGMLALGSSGYGPDGSQKFLSLAEEVFLIAQNF